MTEPGFITKDPSTPLTLEFQSLLRAGLAYAQDYSGAEWTDYNEHDPGVTILETLVFALTDIAYRTGHPIADILASSQRATQSTPERQGFIPPSIAFTTAPVTQDDYRKLLYDQVVGLRDVWLAPVPPGDGPKGLFDVWIQPFAPSPIDIAEHADPPLERIRADVRNVLFKTRALGLDFRRIEIVPQRHYTLDMAITLAPDVNPNSGLAEVLLAIENAQHPLPVIQDVTDLLVSGLPSEELFDGPALSLGALDDGGPHRERMTLDLVKIRAAILGLPDVMAIGAIAMRLTDRQDRPNSIPVLSRTPDDLYAFKLLQNGIPAEIDPAQVLLNLHHLEEQRRWQEQQATSRMEAAGTPAIPAGNSKRNLARYRSIQHMFPEIYGIGPFGTHGSEGLTRDALTRPLAHSARVAKARQLKAFLVFFEQMLTNHLAQLQSTADLLAGSSDQPSYAIQPLTRDTPDPDDAPNLALVLGKPPPEHPATQSNWFARYEAGLKRQRDAVDRPFERRNRAVDHLLARFCEGIDTGRLKRLFDDKSAPRETFEKWMLKRKDEFLSSIVALGRNRGLGLDLSSTKPTALHDRIRLKSGHEEPIIIVEHILLRDAGLPDGIGAETIGGTFVVSDTPPPTGFCLNVQGQSLHWIIAPKSAHGPLDAVLRRLLILGSNPRNYTAQSADTYAISLRVKDELGLAADIVENFPSHSSARIWIDRMSAACGLALKQNTPPGETIHPVFLPTQFQERGVTVIFGQPQGDTPQDQRAFAEEIVSQEMPAHLSPICFWLDCKDIKTFTKLFNSWREAQLCLRAPDPVAPEKIVKAARRSQALRRRIHVLYCAALRDLRHQRRSGAQP